MNRKIRISLSAFIALSLASLAILVFLHYQTKNTIKVTFTEDKKFGVKIDKVHYSGTKEGRVEWVLDAESAKRSKDDDLTVLNTVTAVFYMKNGSTLTVRADEGRYSESTGDINASGNVSVESKEGYSLKTETLRFSTKSRQITTDDPVKITSGGIDIDGTGLLVEIDSGKLVVLKKVKAVFKDTVI